MSEEITGWYLNKDKNHIYLYFEKGIYKQSYNSDFNLNAYYDRSYIDARQLEETLSVYQFWLLNYKELTDDDLLYHPGLTFRNNVVEIKYEKEIHISLLEIYENICKQIAHYKPFAARPHLSHKTFEDLVNDTFTLD